MDTPDQEIPPGTTIICGKVVTTPILLRCLWCKKPADLPGAWLYCCEECRIKGEEREQKWDHEDSHLTFGKD